MESTFKRIDNFGKVITQNSEYFLRVLMMVYLSMRATIRDQSQGLRTIFGVILSQIYFTGWQALPLISVLAITTCSAVILQSTSNLGMLGGSQMIGQVMVAVILREVGPLLTALVVIARSGTAVATELGNMKSNREIEALEVMGINPLSYIVFPRLIGGVVSVICLSICFALIGLMGGFFMTKLTHDMPFGFYFGSIAKALSPSDLGLFLFKISVSGFMIFAIACDQGLSVTQGPTQVPVATTQAVMKSIIYVVAFNLSISIIYYLQQLSELGVLL